jgi:hypothetical protein
VRLSSLGTAATIGQLYEPLMIDDGDCGAIGGMTIGRGNRNTRRKPALVPFCAPQIPRDLTRARTWAVVMGRQRRTARVMTWPTWYTNINSVFHYIIHLASNKTKPCIEPRFPEWERMAGIRTWWHHFRYASIVVQNYEGAAVVSTKSSETRTNCYYPSSSISTTVVANKANWNTDKGRWKVGHNSFNSPDWPLIIHFFCLIKFLI